MKLEMPYLMNVIIYIQNDDINNIPFISKSCLNACNAMKINPWLNPSSNKCNDYNKIMRTFPNLQTLRIDIDSLSEIQYGINESDIIMIDIVHSNYDVDTSFINESLLDKFITSFDGIIRENTKQLYCNIHQTYILNQINNNSKISYVYVQTFSDIEYHINDPNNDSNNDLIDDLNSIKNSVKIRLDLFDYNSKELLRCYNKKNSNITLVQNNNNNTFVIIDENHVELSVSPFKNLEMMYLYEKYYLPTTLTIPFLRKEMNDFTPFKYIKTFRIEDYHVGKQTVLSLPTTTQTFDFNVVYEAAINDIQITNWNDLNSLKKINHSCNLDIPYPQIKFENNLITRRPNNCGGVILSIVLILCCLTLLYSFGNIMYSSLFHTFDLDYLSQKLIIPTLIYYHICAFILLVIFLIFLYLMVRLEVLLASLLLISFYISSLTYGYSLYQYTSKWFILTNIVGIFPSILTFFTITTNLLKIDTFYVIKYIKLLFRNLLPSKLLFNVLTTAKNHYFFLIIFVFAHVLLQIGIGLFISFLNTTTTLSYLCLGCVITFLLLSALSTGVLIIY